METPKYSATPRFSNTPRDLLREETNLEETDPLIESIKIETY